MAVIHVSTDVIDVLSVFVGEWPVISVSTDVIDVLSVFVGCGLS